MSSGDELVLYVDVGSICPICMHRKCMWKCCTVPVANIDDAQMKRSDSKKLKKKTPVAMAF